VLFGKIQSTFQRNIASIFIVIVSQGLFAACLMLVSSSADSEDGGDMIVRNVGSLSPDHTSHIPEDSILHNHHCENLRSKVSINVSRRCPKSLDIEKAQSSPKHMPKYFHHDSPYPVYRDINLFLLQMHYFEGNSTGTHRAAMNYFICVLLNI
jgi:hypothetical protein